ncbi:MAG TPA: CCA tRNA nucleotidyltransferase [Phycisphaerae bacterium]|jgi:poly(A) polymerase|nr:CCA tRNA nucleotidyltransferase [Phycisphaerae bacterium]HQA44011.1 CCA tRNA nucleotidyltransferase [Phycisphaerae bacterium]
MTGKMSLQDAALAIVRQLREHGHQALWAGGCVRDMLLNRPPQDIDIATDATPERIVSLFRKTRKVGMQFGVVLVRQGPYWIEVATFRQDINYTDGRRPEQVLFTTAEEDAKRRDFTINGLFYDPLEDRVIDYVGGREDLAAGVVRAIGNPAERFAEDHLRMLRAVRFAARFGFRLDPSTAEAIREHAHQLTRISPERIREELEKMLSHPTRARAVEQMAELGLMPFLWAGAAWPAERVRMAGAVLAQLPADADFVLGMAALLHDASPAEVEAVGRALRCSNREIDDMAWLVSRQGCLARTQDLALADFKRLAAHPQFKKLMILHKAVCTAYGRPLDGYEAAERLIRLIPADQIAPPPLVTGDDLIGLGLSPGPAFKTILDTLYTAQLNNQLRSRDEAMNRLGEILRQAGQGREAL